MMCEILFYIERFQTLFAGFFGFAGVIITIIGGYLFYRKNNIDEFNRDRYILRNVLLSELAINLESLNKNLEDLRRVPKHGDGKIAMPVYPMDDSYVIFMDKLGLLSASEVKAVMIAYLSLRQYRANLALYGQPHPSSQHSIIDGANIKQLITMVEGVIAPILQAQNIVIENMTTTG